MAKRFQVTITKASVGWNVETCEVDSGNMPVPFSTELAMWPAITEAGAKRKGNRLARKRASNTSYIYDARKVTD
jgi:hypothetical protein